MTNQTGKHLQEIQKILMLADEKQFEAGDMIFEEGKEDNNFYIVLKGDIEILKKTTEGKPKVIAEVESGEFLGEGVLSGITIKPASAKAISPTQMTGSLYCFTMSGSFQPLSSQPSGGP